MSKVCEMVLIALANHPKCVALANDYHDFKTSSFHDVMASCSHLFLLVYRHWHGTTTGKYLLYGDMELCLDDIIWMVMGWCSELRIRLGWWDEIL